MARTVRSLSKPQTNNCHLLVLISGSGTNLQVIIDQCENGTIPAQVCGVISDEPQAKGLQRAKNTRIQTTVVDHRCFDTASLSTLDLERRSIATDRTWWYWPDLCEFSTPSLRGDTTVGC